MAGGGQIDLTHEEGVVCRLAQHGRRARRRVVARMAQVAAQLMLAEGQAEGSLGGGRRAAAGP